MNEMHGSYDLTLVVLSYGIAAIASLTALDLAGRIRVSEGVATHVWLAGGAFAMGTGIWAMHFIGMLALNMPVSFGYDMSLTFVSLTAAILASALALSIVQSGTLAMRRLAFGGIVMGTGVCLMHYVGMEAMQTQGALTYRPLLFVISVLIAVSASMVALWLAFRLNSGMTGRRSPFWQRGMAALVMATGITGMHYTGMAAAIYPPGVMHETSGGVSPDHLAVMVALVSTCIMLAALMMSIYDAHLSSRTARLADSLQRANRELKDMVYRDQLTQLPNRLLFEERLDGQLVQAAGERSGFAVFFVDLDRFKTVNDSLGHHAGDELIKQAASRLQAAVRETDTVARVGGDEFMVITGTGTHREVITTLAQRIVSSFGKPFQIDNTIVRVSSSVGISLYPEHGRDKHELMIHADAAMYCAKDMGRNNFQFFEQGMSSVAERRALLESRLRLAIDNDTLMLAYQPKVNVVTGRITGVEALLRWHDAELGVVSPDELIPVAEDTGLILPIGEWVLRTACRQSKAWYREGHDLLPMAVNLSAIQLNNRNFVTVVRNVLGETHFPPHYLELELTESAIMQNPDHALLILRELRELGVVLSIDDFGTGYSNLSQLKRFPINRLKIDRSFMAGVVSNNQDAAIVKAVVALAHSLNLEIIAEGIETEEQLAFIRQLQGHQYQGYLCSKALPAKELSAFLSTREALET
ncbi:diguanylate cyclase/phosphodiesterase [Modicisalibacter xianhensis]|uniref:cyclic-guanylate-specific phosphodiesterase n=1 Tax=Modicisalibacter xianhensis TaxID=442341 RepID=A0A4R8FYX5_9GAMM|nr:EAL domain-containing protein [Halomonas xianhensis]TDX30860.1 diguanylate cyclase/phosphodiesterase [Halomonas xianhensis]